MSDNRTTELLDGLRNVGNLHEFAELFGFDWHDESDWTWHDVAVKIADELEQAIAATLGSERDAAYNAGFDNGVKATLQQLEDIMNDKWSSSLTKVENIETWITEQWREYEL